MTQARRSHKGFTMVELMITVVVIGIALALATPSYQKFVEKRELTAAAEDITNFIAVAQSLSIKRNQPVNISWDGSGSHSSNFCIGLSEGTTSCDCWETNAADKDYCAVGDVPYVLQKTSFTRISNEFLHFRPSDGNFSFDPVRGNLVGWSDSEVVDGDWLFYMHSNEGSGSSRYFGLEIKLWVTGKTEICFQDYRRMAISAYPDC